MIRAGCMLDQVAREQVISARAHIEGFIKRYPDFATTLEPWPEQALAPKIVRTMIHAGRNAGVGPMAAVAGAVAESVGRKLIHQSRQVIVENGGDVFLKTEKAVVAGLFAGDSPLSMKVGIRVPGTPKGLGLCTSSGTVGHSLSKGRADAVCVMSHSCTLADASATAIGNRVQRHGDIQTAIDFGRTIKGVIGIVIVVEEKMGVWGQVELIPLEGKKG